MWNAADQLGGAFCAIVKLLILTGQRRGEIGGLRTEYIRGNTICLPSELTKNKRTHTFPVGKMARSILSTLPITGLLFPARGHAGSPFNGWSKAKAALNTKIAISRGSEGDPRPLPPWTLHDIRRTYATNLQRLSVKLEVIEALLNHVSGTRSGIVGVYQRHAYEAEMRAAVETFEDWFRRIILAGAGTSREE